MIINITYYHTQGFGKNDKPVSRIRQLNLVSARMRYGEPYRYAIIGFVHRAGNLQRPAHSLQFFGQLVGDLERSLDFQEHRRVRIRLRSTLGYTLS